MLVKHLVALQTLPSGQVTMDLANIEITKAGLHVFPSRNYIPTDCSLYPYEIA